MYKHDREGHFILNYIIDSANVVSDSGISIRSFLIEENKISHYGNTLQKYKGTRMNVSSYIMAPGSVLTDFNLLHKHDLLSYKNSQRELIKKGCTTVLIPCFIPFEKEFEKKIREARHLMINSTLDFVIGVHLPVEKLTPSLIRLCRRQKTPFIIVDVRDDTNLFSIPWGWIREAQFQFQVPIYPLWKIKNKKELDQKKDLWEKITAFHKIPTHLHFPLEHFPLDKVILKQIGIYPQKGELLIGNDLDYTLYSIASEFMKVEEKNKLDYDKANLVITVHKGRLLKVNDDICYYPGFGEELKIHIPGLFASIDIQ